MSENEKKDYTEASRTAVAQVFSQLLHGFDTEDQFVESAPMCHRSFES